MFSFLKEVVNHFLQSNTFQKGAALAYYSVFSFIPIMVILVSVAELAFHDLAVDGEIVKGLSDNIGPQAANQIETIIKNQHTYHDSITTSILGFITLLLGASGMFAQIHNAFNAIWEVEPKKQNGLIKYLYKRLSALSVLTILFIIIVLSVTIQSFLIHHADSLSKASIQWIWVEHIFSFLALAIVFSAMFKFLSDAKISWKTALIGGCFTAILFAFGKILISHHIANSSSSSAYGAASVLVVIMLWVYYTSQIIFLGASVIGSLRKDERSIDQVED